MATSLLIPALLGAGIVAKKAADNKKKKQQERYAVVSEIQGGKGSGAFAVSYITKNLSDAYNYLEQATQVTAKILGGVIVDLSARGFTISGGYDGNFLKGFSVESGEQKIALWVVQY